MELRPNKIKKKLAAGEVAIIVSGLTHPDDIDAVGPMGFDGAWLEGEHGASDPADLGNLTRACDVWGMTSVARINKNDQGMIYRTLDRGVQSVVVPHINTKAEAENVVQGGKFAPIEQRGLFTSRQGYGVGDYLKKANDETSLIILIEDIAAYENLDEILEVDHIDAFFVAPSDFAASMGHIGEINHPDVQAKIDGSIEKIVKSGRTAGTLATTENVGHFVDIGVKLFMVSALPWIAAGADQFRKNAGLG